LAVPAATVAALHASEDPALAKGDTVDYVKGVVSTVDLGVGAPQQIELHRTVELQPGVSLSIHLPQMILVLGDDRPVGSRTHAIGAEKQARERPFPFLLAGGPREHGYQTICDASSLRLPVGPEAMFITSQSADLLLAERKIPRPRDIASRCA